MSVVGSARGCSTGRSKGLLRAARRGSASTPTRSTIRGRSTLIAERAFAPCAAKARNCRIRACCGPTSIAGRRSKACAIVRFMTAKKSYTKPDTVLAVAGRDPANNFGIVNPPVYHASTILSPTMEKFENRVPFEGYGYGRNGTPTQKALEDAVAAIEGAHRSIAVQSGLAAVTGAIVGFLKTGDHMLLTANAYGPARRFANTTLKNFGVETTFFDPMIGAGIEKLMQPNTKIVYLEAPGSQTFE